jgi:hypothetical protein
VGNTLVAEGVIFRSGTKDGYVRVLSFDDKELEAEWLDSGEYKGHVHTYTFSDLSETDKSDSD